MTKRFQQLKKSIQQHPVYILLGAAFLGLAGFATYRYICKIKNQKTPKIQVDQQQTFQQIYKQVILSLQQSLAKYGSLSPQMIKSIIKNQYKLAQLQYKNFIIKARNQRRKTIQNKHQYRRLVLLTEKNIQEIFDKNLNAILAHFNIQKTFWIETIEFWTTETEENTEEWQELLSELETQIVQTLRDKSKSPLSYKKLEDILNFMINELKNINQSGLEFDNIMTQNDEPDLSGKFKLIQKYLQDLVFKKYGIEEQDMLYSQRKLSQIDNQNFLKIKNQFTDLLSQIVYGKQESEPQADSSRIEPGQQQIIQSQSEQKHQRINSGNAVPSDDEQSHYF